MSDLKDQGNPESTVRIPDDKLFTCWKCRYPQGQDCLENVWVDLTYFNANGTPVCPGCDADMRYHHAELHMTAAEIVALAEAGPATVDKVAEAYEYVMSWASMETNKGPDCCIRKLDAECRPLSEQHREDVRNHLRACRMCVVESPKLYPFDELERLDAFVAFFMKRPLQGGVSA